MPDELRPIAPDVSVVVPTIGRDLLEGCLQSIADGTVWPAHLLVVDQGRRDSVRGWVEGLQRRGLRARHVPSAQTGISAGTNRGLELVATEFVAVTHDDCRVRPDWLETLAVRVREIGDAILTGMVEADGDGVVLTVTTKADSAVYTEPLIDGDVLFPPNMAFPLRVLDRVGYFDEHPALRLAGEDNEWAYRALRAGVPIVYDPGVAVGHAARHTDADLTDLYRRYARGQGAFYGRHLRRADRFVARRAARDLIRGPWLLARGLASRNPKLVAMGRGEVAGILPGILAGIRNRGQTP